MKKISKLDIYKSIRKKLPKSTYIFHRKNREKRTDVKKDCKGWRDTFNNN